MLLLRNPIQRYDWGSPGRLAGFLGEPPTAERQAELWMGAHPSAPSKVRLTARAAAPTASAGAAVSGGPARSVDPTGDETWVGLDELIAGDAPRWVGAEVMERFGPTLPFLFKVLAAAQPLSLQLHPGREAAAMGFAAEEAAGISLADPARRYRDPNHKPELLVAIDGFEVLSGFRSRPQMEDVFRAFNLPPPWVALAGSLEPGELCARLWQLDPPDVSALVARVTQAAGPAEDGSPAASPARRGSVEPAPRFGAERDFVRRASACHPGDIGVVVGLCLNRISLQPGQGAFAEPGVLHSYLGGFGLEIMANSDNVMRAGLTTKLVDVGELQRHLVGHATTPRRLTAKAHQLPGGVERRFDVLVDEFALSSLHPDAAADTAMLVRSGGPEILLCVTGSVSLFLEVADRADRAGGAHGGSRGYPAEPAARLGPGASAFLPAGHSVYGISGAGTVYRAQVGFHARRLWAE